MQGDITSRPCVTTRRPHAIAAALLTLLVTDPSVGDAGTATPLTLRAAPFMVNVYTTADQQRPSVRFGLDDGQLAVSWDGDFGYGIDAVGVRYHDADGNATSNVVMGVADTNARRIAPKLGLGTIQFGDFILTLIEGAAEDSATVKIQTSTPSGPGLPNPVPAFTANDLFFKQQLVFQMLRANFGEPIAWLICAVGGVSGLIPPDIYCRALSLGALPGSLTVGQANGTVDAPEFVVHSDASGYQYAPAGCATKDGGFVVVWEELGGDGDRDGLFARKFDANLDPAGDDFAVNTYTTGDQENASVCCRRDGGFTVAWSSQSRGIFGRMFDASAQPVSDEIPLSLPDSLSESEPVILCDGRDNFVVTWMDPGFPGRVAVRGFDKTAVPLTDEVDVVAGTTDSRITSRTIGADMTAPGRLAIAWSQANVAGGDGEDVFTAIYDFDGGGSTTTLPSTTTSTVTTSTTTLSTTSTTVTSTTSTTTTLPVAVCGDPSDNPSPSSAIRGPSGALITATDALFTLKAAVGVETCALCVCDVDDSGAISATDALAVLKKAVGVSIELTCPPCS